MTRFLVLLLCSCAVAVPDLKVQAQVAVDDVSLAIRTSDVELFKSRYAPEVYEHGGSTIAERDENTAFFMDTQREGLRHFYGAAAPRVVNVLREGAIVTVGISPDGTEKDMSPKRLRFREVDGRLMYLGIFDLPIGDQHEEGGVGVVRQATDSTDPTFQVTWDVQNPSAIGHAYVYTWDNKENTLPGCGPGEGGATYSIITTNCTTFGWNYRQLVASGAATTFCVRSDYHGGTNNYNVAMMVPTQVGLPCGTGLITSPANCCWINGWGWDLYWASNDTFGSSGPSCSWGGCPP